MDYNEEFYNQFYKQVITILNILTLNTPMCYAMYSITYEFKEFNPNNPINNGWKTYTQTVQCDSWHIEDIKNKEEFYKQESYNWQPKILEIKRCYD